MKNSTNKFKFQKAHFISIFVFACFFPSLESSLLRAQCNDLCVSDDCGQLSIGFSPTGDNVVCEGEIIELLNISDPGFDYFILNWDDGIIDTVAGEIESVVHTYAIPDSLICEGDREISFCFKGVKNCQEGQTCVSGSYAFLLKVRPNSHFESLNSACFNSPISFVNQSCNADTYLWRFGNGMESIEPDPVTVYPSLGAYTVSLISTNECGSHESLSILNIVDELEININSDGVQLYSQDRPGQFQWVNCGVGYMPIPGANLWHFSPEEAGQYAVIYTEGECVDTSECVDFATTRVSTPAPGLQIHISPNPVKDWIQVILDGPTSSNHYIFYNIQGQKTGTDGIIQTEKTSIDISILPPGLYYLALTDNHQIVSFCKVIKL